MISPELLLKQRKHLHNNELRASALRAEKLQRYSDEEKSDSSSGSHRHPFLLDEHWNKSPYSVKREDCEYASHWCEENTWKLLSKIKKEYPDSFDSAYAVFISNEKLLVPLWNAASVHRNECVYWEYHVIAVIKGNSSHEAVVYDFDSRAPFPALFSDYFTTTFPSHQHLPKNLERQFRVVEGLELLLNFSDDRTPHTLGDPPAPKWDPITLQGKPNNLAKFITMSEKDFFGKVLDQDQFHDFFAFK